MDTTLSGSLGKAWPLLSQGTFNRTLLATLEQQNAITSQNPIAANFPESLRERLLEEARQQAAEPWPQPLGSDLIRAHTDGNRAAYEDKVRARQTRLTRMVIAALLAPKDPLWLNQVIDGTLALCEQLSWCWPVHDDSLERKGWFLPDPDRHYLDLGAAEVCAQLSCIDLMLGARLDEAAPGLRERMRRESEQRCFTPFLEDEQWHWLGTQTAAHNWCAWIHANLLVSALNLGAGDQQLQDVAWRALQGLERYIDVLPSDGAIDEGFSYWWNGAGRALEALDRLSQATAGALPEVAPVASLTETVTFPWKMRLGPGIYVSYADAAARPHEALPWPTLWRASRATGNKEAEEFALSQFAESTSLHPELGLPRLLRTVGDTDLFAALAALEGSDQASEVGYASSVHFPSIGFALARNKDARNNGLTVTLKGGHNGENHNHNDVGTVTVAVAGEPLIVDAGRLEYTAKTFSDQRYSIWAMTSLWHSVPVIAGVEQAPGEEFRALEFTFEDDGEVARFGVEIANAYPLGDAALPGHAWRRALTLDRVANMAELTDRWAGVGEHHTVNFIARGDVRVQEDAVEVVGERSALRMVLADDAGQTVSGAQISVTTIELADPLMAASWGATLSRIAVETNGKGPLVTRFYPAEGPSTREP